MARSGTLCRLLFIFATATAGESSSVEVTEEGERSRSDTGFLSAGTIAEDPGVSDVCASIETALLINVKSPVDCRNWWWCPPSSNKEDVSEFISLESDI